MRPGSNSGGGLVRPGSNNGGGFGGGFAQPRPSYGSGSYGSKEIINMKEYIVFLKKTLARA